MDRNPAHGRRVLAETCGGLRVAYDGTGLTPNVTLDSPDGSIELRGPREIHAATLALLHGARMADNFGPPLDLMHWRTANAQ